MIRRIWIKKSFTGEVMTKVGEAQQTSCSYCCKPLVNTHYLFHYVSYCSKGEESCLMGEDGQRKNGNGGVWLQKYLPLPHLFKSMFKFSFSGNMKWIS